MTSADEPGDAAADLQALLELMLADEGVQLAGAGLGRRDRTQPGVLSYAQERMWFLEGFEARTAALVIQGSVALHGGLDRRALRLSLDEIFRRHDVLRTVIETDAGIPRPVQLPTMSMPFHELDVDGDHEALADILNREAVREFDLAREPPIVITLVRVADEHHVLSVVMHHAASDHSSFDVFFRELAVVYSAFVKGTPSPLPDLVVQYDDYAWWQRHGATDVFDRQLAYWREQLAGPLPVFEIPPDFSRPARQTLDGATVSASVPRGLVDRLDALCKQTGTTTFMALLAAFEVVVSRHAGETDVIIGTPVAGRVRLELEPMIGAFINTVVLRNDLSDRPTFRTLLDRVRETSVAAFTHQDVPFDLLLAELSPPRDLSRTPVFQIFFNMTHLDSIGGAYSLDGVRTETLEPTVLGAKFDITMYVNESADGIEMRLVYNRALYEHEHMELLVEHYVRLLEQALDQPDRRIDEYELVGERDRAVLPDPLLHLDSTWHGSVPEHVRRAAARAPERVAVSDGSDAWSYALLAEQMHSVAAWLAARGVGRGDVVAIYARRSGSLVPAITGVLASGAAYVIIDARYPPARAAQLLRVAQPSAWVAIDGTGPLPAEVVDALDELTVDHRCTLPSTTEPGRVAGALDVAISDLERVSAVEVGPDDMACLTFTSGSTGVPKAVVGRHGSLTHFLPWMSREFGVHENDRFSMLSGLSHDPLQRDIFWPLSLGASIVVPDAELIGSPGYLARWLSSERVTVAHLTPAMGQLVTETFGVGGDVAVPSLRVALFIGDVLTRGQVSRFVEVAPNAFVVSMYGTTETQRASGYHLPGSERELPPGVRAKEVLPLGRGMPGAQLLVRADGGGAAAIGEVGEVVFRSPHLALGYWHDEVATASRFSRDPAGTSARDQLYASGDRGRYRPDGSVEFLGRNDDQVQLRGFRIELGEIAAALRREPGVSDAVVALRADDPSGPRLVAYVVPVPGTQLDAPGLVQSLRSVLPAHMVPSDVVELDRVPLTHNGKIDRRALPAPMRLDSSLDWTDSPPRDQMEETLLEIWQQVLGRDDIGIHHDFFSLGGYSLLATRVLAMIEVRTGTRRPVAMLFEHPTIAALSARISDPAARARVEATAALRARVAAMTADEVDAQLAEVVERAADAPSIADDELSKRESLLRLLLADEGLHSSAASIERRDPAEPPVLSFAQERMWFLEQFETDTTPLVVRTIVAMHGALDAGALRRGLDEIFARHDVLRTVIVKESGDPRPVVLPVGEMPVVEVDVDGDLDALAALVTRESMRTFDLEHEPPIVVTVVRISDTHHVLSVVMHHVASDATSMTVFFRELAALYTAFRDGKPSPLRPLAVQYDDYAWWQRNAATEMHERQLLHWQHHLSDLPSFEIPPDHTRPARHQVAGGAVTTQLSGELAAAVAELSRGTGATTFMVLLAAFEVVAARHAGETDVVVGIPIAGRARPELEPLIGACLNTLVLRNELGDGPSFRTLIERVRRTSLDAYDNQDVPFERLLAELRPPRDLSRTPLFQIFFNMTHIESGSDEFVLPGLKFEIVEQPDRGSKFDLTMYVNEASSGTDLRLVYNRSLYEHSHMQRLVEQFVHVLEQVVADPDLPIDRLSLGTAADAEVLPDDSLPLDATWHGSVPDAVRRVAARDPGRLAVIDASRSWSFGLLAMQMARLASWLRVRHVGRGDIVAIYGHRSGSLVWTVTGVLASGAAYVLLDPRYPASRIAQILRIAKPKAWVALDAAGPPSPELIDVLDQLQVQHRLSLPETADLDELDAVLELAGPPASPDDAVDIGPDDVACLTFTSGSTGVPKGVIGRHGSLTHFLPWMSEEFGVGEDDRFSMLSGLSHDPLQRDIFWPLWLGATIVVPDPDAMATAGWLARWMRDHLVSVAHLTPAMGQLLTEGFQPGRSETVPSLRRALFIGDVLTRSDVERLRALAPEVRIINLYGTTETQRASGYHVLDLDADVPDGVQPKETLPLGRGMPGSQLLVRSRDGRQAAVGEVGEVVMRSPHLAIGYWDDEGLTGERFQRDPFGTSVHDQLYATGDLGRYRADGSVEFLGRADDQVQLRGFRIEFGEVAAALRAQPDVADAVVLLRHDDPDRPALVGYVIASPGQALDTRDVIRSLRTSLPAHMVPTDVVQIDRLPLTPNGKLDRRALPAPAEQAASTDDAPPHDSLEWILLDIWQKVLGRKHISVHDDFFALGGYSLLATRLFAILEERTGHRLPVSVLFEHPTIAALATAIRDDGWRTEWSSLVPIQPAGAAQPFFYVAPYMISVLELAPLGDELGSDRPLYGLQPQGLDGTLPAHPTIEEMAAHYIAEMKSVQPEGPYAIGGHCAGSWVAFEMARQLEAAGDEISALALVDQGPPGVEKPEIKKLPYIAHRIRFYFSGGRLRQAMAWKFKIITGRLLLRRVGSPTARFEEQVKEVHRAAYRAYQGGRIAHDITLVLSADSLSLDDKAWYRHWSEVTDGRLTTKNVGGTHANLLVQPFVHDLAREIAAVLDQPVVDDADQPAADAPPSAT